MKTNVVVKIFIITVLFLAFFCPGYVAAQTGKVIELTYATSFPPDHPMSRPDILWIAKIEKETNGRVKIKPYWGSSMMNIREATDELRNGVADIAYIMPPLEKTGFPLTKAMYVFSYGANQELSGRRLQEVMRRVVSEVRAKFPEIEKEYTDLKVLSWSSGAAYQLFTSKKPIRKMEDMKGMRIKAMGEAVDALRQFGAEGVGTPMTETYVSMQKGVLDAAFAPLGTLKSMSLAEVTKYCTMIDYYFTHTGMRAMSMKGFNKLPPDIRKIFENNIEYWGMETDKSFEKDDEDAVDYAKKMGVEFIKLPKEEIAKFNSALAKTAVEQAKALDAKGLPGTKVFNEMQRLIQLYSKK